MTAHYHLVQVKILLHSLYGTLLLVKDEYQMGGTRNAQLIGHVQVIEMVRIRHFDNREVNNGFKAILNILSGEFLCKNLKKMTWCVGKFDIILFGVVAGLQNLCTWETLYLGNIVLFSQLPWKKSYCGTSVKFLTLL